MAEFPHQDMRDPDLVFVPEHARIRRLVQHRQRVAQDQAVCGQPAIALPLHGGDDDPADLAQLSTVGDKLDLRRHGDELL
jgi:hypothetical protein